MHYAPHVNLVCRKEPVSTGPVLRKEGEPMSPMTIAHLPSPGR